MKNHHQEFRAALARFVAAGHQEQEAAKLLGYAATTLSALKNGLGQQTLNPRHVLAMQRLADMAEAGEL